ncbi:MAG: hypothetical protein EOL86_10745 [Deltaproteobacteria bacterium]|nr:hypothetical protein [Deltaproteobacteria bacterium]
MRKFGGNAVGRIYSDATAGKITPTDTDTLAGIAWEAKALAGTSGPVWLGQHGQKFGHLKVSLKCQKKKKGSRFYI